MFWIGLIIGAILGMLYLALAQINNENRMERERDYWKAEALKWCARLGENKIAEAGRIGGNNNGNHICNR